MLSSLLGAAAAAPRRRRPRAAARGRRWRVVAFLVANPYALLDVQRVPRRAAAPVRTASGDAAASSACTQISGILYYVGTAPGGSAGCRSWPRRRARSGCRQRPPAGAVLLAPRRSCSCSSWATQDALLRPLAAARLPDPLPAGGLGGGRAHAARRPGWIVAAAAPLCAQGLVFSIHNDLVLRPRRHAPAGPRLDGRPRPDGLEGRGRAGLPGPVGGRRRAAHPGAPRNGSRWNKWPTSRVG